VNHADKPPEARSPGFYILNSQFSIPNLRFAILDFQFSILNSPRLRHATAGLLLARLGPVRYSVRQA